MYNLFIYVLLGSIMGFWMYADAKKRNLEKPSTWIWIGAMFNIVGLLTYGYWHMWSKKAQIQTASTAQSKQTTRSVLPEVIAFLAVLVFGLILYVGGVQSPEDGASGLVVVFGAFILLIDFFFLLYIIWIIDRNKYRKKH